MPRPAPRWSGIDDDQAAGILVLQVNLLAPRLEECLASLAEFRATMDRMGIRPGFALERRRSKERPPTALIGVSARLFKGPIRAGRDDSAHSRRWNQPVRCPGSLRTMDLKRDTEFDAFLTEEQIAAHETDLCVLVEADDETLLRAVGREASRLTERAALEVRAAHFGARQGGNRDSFGFEDGLSNLQHLRDNEPARYASYLFTRDQAGEIDGTYLSFRKYRTYPERLAAGEPLILAPSRGDPERRLAIGQVIGRDRATGLVIDAETGRLLAPEPDERQVSRADLQSHARRANPRGRGRTSFGDPVYVADVRILRRSFPYDTRDECGLLFLAFQADIQERGFEFIHNEWLMSRFNGAPDPLLAPESGLVEPLTGCYYFIPREQRAIAEGVGGLLLASGYSGPSASARNSTGIASA